MKIEKLVRLVNGVEQLDETGDASFFRYVRDVSEEKEGSVEELMIGYLKWSVGIELK